MTAHNGPSAADPPLLVVSGLKVAFEAADQVSPRVVVDGFELVVRPGRTLGLVGESGSGKSVACLAILGLLPETGRVLAGRIEFAGNDLAQATEPVLRGVRGKDIAMIFQDPVTSLNPLRRVGWQIAEALRIHQRLCGVAATARVLELMREVGIPDPDARMHSFPHQLSGGLCQRVMIAIALACRPRMLIADEPTTALDVTIQAQILDLLDRLRREIDASVLLITHDLAVVAEVSDDVAVMYAGRVVESAPVAALFDAPRHPYTVGLLRALEARAQRSHRLPVIDGAVPSPDAWPPGCRFAPRCARVSAQCVSTSPALQDVGYLHKVACHHPLPGTA